MQKYFMLVEAVNISHFVYDTHDISTIRGGSFILLDAVNQLATAFSGRLHPISTAASQGLFWYEHETILDTSWPVFVQDVLFFLHKKTGGYATFVIATEPDIPGNFPQVLEKLHAQIRRQQWRIPSIAIPESVATDQECFLDGWRPGSVPYQVDPDVRGAKISAATQFRRDSGRSIKHRLFFNLLKDAEYEDNLCAKDLGQLARDPSKGILSGKVAFIHVDGNSFGRIRRDLCITPDTRSEFDRQIQEGCRKPFLSALLRLANKDADFQTVDAEDKVALRLEVLLWGGDEMILVVPGWKGMEVVELFFEHANGLAFNGIQLSHRAAVVFCHHNAPILQIRRLAEDLLAQTRLDIKAGIGESVAADPVFNGMSSAERDNLIARFSTHDLGTGMHYLVLESFDMLGGSLTDFLRRYYKDVEYRTLLLHAPEFGMLRENLTVVRSNVSRGKVLEIIDALQKGDIERFELIRRQLAASVVPANLSKVEAALEALAGGRLTCWYLIADLWDYIPEWNR